jgi:hypothetical protein
MLSVHIFNLLSISFSKKKEGYDMTSPVLVSVICDIWLLLFLFEYISCLSLCYRQEMNAASH